MFLFQFHSLFEMFPSLPFTWQENGCLAVVDNDEQLCKVVDVQKYRKVI